MPSTRVAEDAQTSNQFRHFRKEAGEKNFLGGDATIAGFQPRKLLLTHIFTNATTCKTNKTNMSKTTH